MNHDRDCPVCFPRAVERDLVIVADCGHTSPIDGCHVVQGKTYCPECLHSGINQAIFFDASKEHNK